MFVLALQKKMLQQVLLAIRMFQHQRLGHYFQRLLLEAILLMMALELDCYQRLIAVQLQTRTCVMRIHFVSGIRLHVKTLR